MTNPALTPSKSERARRHVAFAVNVLTRLAALATDFGEHFGSPRLCKTARRVAKVAPMLVGLGQVVFAAQEDT